MLGHSTLRILSSPSRDISSVLRIAGPPGARSKDCTSNTSNVEKIPAICSTTREWTTRTVLAVSE